MGLCVFEGWSRRERSSYRRERGWIASIRERASVVSPLPAVTPTRARCSAFTPWEEKRGRTDSSAATSAAVRTQRGDSEAEKNTHTSTHPRSVPQNLVYGYICGSTIATQADMEEYLRRVQSRLGVSWEPSVALMTPPCGYNEWDRDGEGASAVLRAVLLLLRQHRYRKLWFPPLPPPTTPNKHL